MDSAGAEDLDGDRLAAAVRCAVRDLVRMHAPPESEVVDALTARWRPTGRRPWPAAPGGAVRFGVDTQTLTELLLAVGSQVVGQLAAAGAVAGWVAGRRRRRRAAKVQATQPTVPTMAETADRVRQAVLAHSAAAGVPDELAALYADAVVGALVAGRSEPHAPRDTARGDGTVAPS